VFFKVQRLCNFTAASGIFRNRKRDGDGVITGPQVSYLAVAQHRYLSERGRKGEERKKENGAGCSLQRQLPDWIRPHAHVLGE